MLHGNPLIQEQLLLSVDNDHGTLSILLSVLFVLEFYRSNKLNHVDMLKKEF